MADALDSLQVNIALNAKSAMDSLEDLIEKIKDLRDAITSPIGKTGILKDIENIGDALGKGGLGGASRDAQSSLDDLGKATQAVGDRMNSTAKDIENLSKEAEDAAEEIESVFDQIEKRVYSPDGIGKAYQIAMRNLRSDKGLSSQRAREQREDERFNQAALKLQHDRIAREAETMRKEVAAAKAKQRAQEEAERAAQRAAEKSAKERERLAEKEARAAQKAAEVRSKLAEKTAREEAKAAEKAAREEQVARETAIQRVTDIAKNIKGAFSNALRGTIRLVEGLGNAFVKVGSVITRIIAAPFKRIANSITSIYKKITGLFRSIGRIALYRAIRTAIKTVTQGLNEGIQNLYQWSLMMDKTFANSMDSIATSMQYLHNGFASMFSPLIEYAAPILEEITNKLVDFFNIVQQVFASLTGQATWTKAVRVQKQYAEAVTDTGNAAEKAMHQLMAFDELNVINSPSAGGSAGGSTIPDYGSMFTTETVDTELANWVEEIKRFFESGQFYELGQFVGEKLNGIVSQWESYADGFKFGEKIKHALQALNGFLETFDFYDLGTKVGDWLIGFLDGVSPEEVQKAVVNIINSAVSGASGLIDSLVAHNVPIKIGQAIGTAFAMVDWAGLTNLARKFLLGIVDMLNAAINSFISNGGPSKLVDAMGEIGLAIGEAFATFDWVGAITVATSIFTGLVNMLTSAISSFVSLGGPAKLRSAMGQIGEAIGSAFASISGPDLAAIINAIAGGIKDFLVKGIKAFSKGEGWKEVGKLFANLDWGTLFTLTLPLLTLNVLKVGTNLTAAILKQALVSAIFNGGAATIAGLGSALGIGTLVAAGAALAIGITLYATWKWANGEDPITGTTFIDNHDGTYTVLTPQAAAAGEAESYKGTQEYVDSLMSGLESTAFERFGDLTPTLKDIADSTGDIADSLKVYDELFGGSGVSLPGIGGKTADRIGIPIGLDLSKLDSEIAFSDAPAKARVFGKRIGDSIKFGTDDSNVPAKYRQTALASLDAFGNIDFTSGGTSSGNEIKNGFNASNVAGVVSSAAQSAINAFRSADWAGTGAQGGATLGATFKNHFVANAKSTLMLQTAAGKPITQAYVVPYAQGGFVSQGGLFLAGEVAGQAEMVGSINGRTGVASGEEITGIREAVVASGNEEAALLRQQNQLLQALLMKDPFGTPNSAAGRWIAQSSQAYKAVTG